MAVPASVERSIGMAGNKRGLNLEMPGIQRRGVSGVEFAMLHGDLVEGRQGRRHRDQQAEQGDVGLRCAVRQDRLLLVFGS